MSFARNSLYSNTFYNGANLGALTPNPFLDMASFRLPTNFKSLFPLFEYCATIDGTISPIVNKISEYTSMPLDYSSIKNKNMVEFMRSILEEDLDIKNIDIQLTKDCNTYGSGFATIHFPFKRFFTCRNCKHNMSAEFVPNYDYRNFQFYFKCSSCGNSSLPKDYDDLYYKNTSETKIKIWRPHDIDIIEAPFSGATQYFYTPPPEVIASINAGNKFILDNTHKTILESIKGRSKILFNSGTIFHRRRVSVSKGDLGSQVWGTPLVLSAVHNVFLKKMFAKTTEVATTLRSSPASIIYPETNGAAGSLGNPMMATSIVNFQAHLQEEMAKHRNDPGYVMTMPHPVGLQNLFGDSKNFNYLAEMKYQDEASIIATGTPREFIEGGLQFSSSSIPLRMFENQLLQQFTQSNKFITWVQKRLSSFYTTSEEKITMKKFRMADDIALLQMQLQAAANGDLSKKRIWESTTLDISYEEELKLIGSEDKEKFKTFRDRAIMEARSQIDSQKLMSIAQAKLQPQSEMAILREQADMQNMEPSYALYMANQQRQQMQEQQLQQQQMQLQQQQFMQKQVELKEQQQDRLSNQAGMPEDNDNSSSVLAVAAQLKKFSDMLASGKVDPRTLYQKMLEKAPNSIDEVYRTIVYALSSEKNPEKLERLVVAEQIFRGEQQ